MEEFAVCTTVESYTANNGKYKSVGELYVRLDSYAFPEIGWTDFGCDVIYWWMESFIQLLTEREKKVRCSFMDGPFKFEVEVQSSDVWQITFKEELAEGENVEHQSSVSSKQAAKAVLQAAKILAQIVKEKDGERGYKNFEQRMQFLNNFVLNS